MIVSGHRRYAACRLVGLSAIRVRVVGVRSTDPEFPRLLTSYNRQRVKAADELIREEVVRTDPEDAHHVLEEYRAKASRVAVETMPLCRANQTRGDQPGQAADAPGYRPGADGESHLLAAV